MRKQTMIALTGAAAISLSFAGTAQAGVLFFDNFDNEYLKTNYDDFENWDVSEGTVDLIGEDNFFDFLPGNGRYVDMDGSTNDAGKITTKNLFTFESGKTYQLMFDMAGSQRAESPEDSVVLEVGLGTLLSRTITLDSNEPFMTYTETFVGDGTSANLSFEGIGNDKRGLLLDNVKLTAVPEPASMLGLLAVGAVAAGGVIKRKVTA